VEAATGNYVWAERYDRDLADIFAVQDDIATEVTIAIAPAIADAELHRAMRKPPDSLNGWGAYQRGLWHLGKFTAEDTAAAERFFEQAIELDPNFSGGYSGLAAAQLQAANTFIIRDMDEMTRSAEALARQAIDLDAHNAEARTCLGRVLLNFGDYEGARLEIQHALLLNPNLAIAHSTLGSTLIFSGHPQEGLALLEHGISLDPRNPCAGVSLNQIVLGLYLIRDYERAVGAARRVIRSYPNHPLVYHWLAAALGQLGRTAEAKEALSRAIALSAISFEIYVRRRVPWHRPEDHAHMLDGLRKAGWDD
jgi:adenylate cyclase